MRIWPLLLLAYGAHAAVVWYDTPGVCTLTNFKPSYGVLCSLGSYGACNGTTIRITTTGEACAGAVWYTIDTHGRADIAWREAARTPGACGAVTFRAEALTPRPLSALSVRATCAASACSPRTARVDILGVEQCTSMVVGDAAAGCDDPTPAILTVPFPNGTACEGVTVLFDVPNSPNASLTVETHTLSAQSFVSEITPNQVAMHVHTPTPIPAPKGLTVIATCAGSDPVVTVSGSCPPTAYAGWCTLDTAGRELVCFETVPWVPGTMLRVSGGAHVTYGGATYGPGAWPVPPTPRVVATLTCTSGCTRGTAMLAVPVALVPPPLSPLSPSPPPAPMVEGTVCGPATQCEPRDCQFTAYGGQAVCLNVCNDAPYNISLILIGLQNATLQTVSADPGCAGFAFDSPGTNTYVVSVDGATPQSLNYSFGVSDSVKSSAVIRCLSGPCESGARIAGGTDAPYTQFMVSLRTPSNTHFCGATLLTSTIALTAAHCSRYALMGAMAITGAADLSNPFVGTTVAVVGAAWHAAFNDADATHAADIGMVVFAEPVTETLVKLDVDPVHHATVIKSLMGNFAAVAMGWGTDQTGTLQAKLQMAALMIASPKACAVTLKQGVAPDAICVGDGVGRVQVCPGDSGGPLLWLNELDITSDVLTASTQIGIVSWGGACQDNLPYSVFVDISSHGDWIDAAAARLENATAAEGCDVDDVCYTHISIAPPAPPTPPGPPGYPSFFTGKSAPPRPPPPVGGSAGRSGFTNRSAANVTAMPDAPGVPAAAITVGVAGAAVIAAFAIMQCSGVRFGGI